ncbi:hypothetical protein AUJ14_01070 [Candidatus Micrarchaeota archaeon CG1_02_55_22]|nr:MAG: hypothetical protein AUJ14_01070 [Candidatus Micrarchaeota archaeon CG1_02_55_22]
MPEEEQNEIYQKKLAEMQAAQEREATIKSALKQAMEPAALERLANVKLSNAELYEQVASFVLYAARQGQLRGKVTEEQLKLIIGKVLSQRRETKISFSRK